MEPTDVPRTLGRYQLLARIATGGMGEVFLARLEGAAGFEKLYAVKRILPHLASEERFRSMLIAEAQIAARMSHPNICQVYELGESNGQLYIAMEYLEGTSVDGLLRGAGKSQTPLDLGCIATIIRQTCDALHHAHELRDRDGAPLELVHRDVSPANIFVCTSGAAKVLDFGIAKVKHGAQTQTGTVKGKYAYMAPEQLRGTGALSRKVDVFALGAVLFEMLALRRLFQRDTDYLTFRAVLEDPLPDVRRYRSDTPPPLADALARALARDPAERWPTARAFSDAVLAAIPAPWPEDRVGELVRSTMASDLAHTSDAIKTVIARGPKPITPADAPLTQMSADDLPAVDATAATSVAPPAGKTTSRAPLLIVLALLVVGGAAVGVVMYMRAQKTEPVVIDKTDSDTRESDLEAVVPYMPKLNQCASKYPSKLDETTAAIMIDRDGHMRTTSYEPATLEQPLADCMTEVLRNVAFTTRNQESLLSLTIRLPKH